ncbi:N-formylglutamate deformylase [Sphingomonas sp. EC-HK361]|uniref:N-formylglutamate deformylase n=1 Tax=Sphingomonas sp. EC-HK361 TaxID=2038397 RepID=UPI0012545C6C|nr:N-formylglutamate deformylase [Sphingomonas sp. EC-HK361]VVT14480.1 N-formylglutamate deformylase [Sphingomonas sp. EC-HK361]
MTHWLHVRRADTPLILAFPHGGTAIPDDLLGAFRSRWWAIRDADWHIRQLYDGLADATMIWNDMSRSVIDCNRDPSGASLYPGQATTGLCPTETFDGEPLYRDGATPDIAARRAAWFTPYHAAIEAEIARLRAHHPRVVLYDCHAIRSRIPRLFDGELPELNIGTDGGATCAPALSEAVVAACRGRSHILNGRFRGGWTTRHYGRPEEGVHAIQMEIAMRAYLDEPPDEPDEHNWPPVWNPARAAPLRADLERILAAVTAFAKDQT